MALALARYLITKCNFRRTSIRIDKPSALLLAQAASVEITRDRSHFPPVSSPALAASTSLVPNAAASPAPPAAPAGAATVPVAPRGTDAGVGRHCVYLALGSNLGDRAAHIARALDLLVSDAGCTIADTAFLYETPPAYVVDQPSFLNTACKIYTELSPHDLLAALKRIEAALGRQPTVRYGPRTVDLDILFYDDLELRDPDLTIPHALLHEREFVLRPLCDIASAHEHPVLQKTVGHLLLHLKERSAIWRVLPVAPNTVWRWGERTRLMGILNITDDSFSDGGKYLTADAAVAHAQHMVADGADIIDIGGMSSRPHAVEVPPEVEAGRVVEVIRRLRAASVTAPISVDTYRASVAAAALEAGANMVNDISGGARDPAMRPLLARAGVPLCLMHMRGDASTMTTAAAKTYDGPGGVLAAVRTELGDAVGAALAAGVRRWNVLVDPGLGFAKNPAQSLELVRGLRELVAPGHQLAGFPTLAGPSRKGFVGAVVHRDVDGRAWGTAAACAALVSQGVDVLRVHDVKEMVEVIRMGDAIWRASPGSE